MIARTNCIADLRPILAQLQLEDGARSSSSINGDQDILESAQLSEIHWIPLRQEFVKVDPHDLCLFEQIGMGRSSQVLRAKWTSRSEIVAVKQLGGNSTALPLDTWHRIRHPNIVKLLGASRDLQPTHIVVEYCAGGSCFDLLHAHPEIHIQLSQKGRMLRTIAEALDYIHSFNPQIIHGDLKSRNVLLATPFAESTIAPSVRVSCFGSILERAWYMSDTHMDASVGTLQWMAPEILNGNTFTAKMDIYSYGMLMYEVVSRGLPFGDTKDCEVKTQVLAGLRPCIPEGCPQQATQLMMRCWAARPDHRPSFKEIINELHRRDPFGCAD
mmetsp:Transcript_107060/g.185183  ORF Transcript_107060/g.185183 Transcript_107060/m.185183 type:complete len:328 (+) Transcript_107060:60-1043(+)